ncbi:ArsR/SmtB family transcription factor [Ancylobacter polymorphus]|uniref:ArsR family transcriptional regulator n=1 Tax=Ancylobacter polymorphus TaxID=223390 RepID=A0ABU0BCI7_9HYPH|nr:metalloregulator ArsR/SmtB family transcription factor [Ancylobacter polymorphus]MDQ0303545.1 ArsR family transcriptional regulator [Ancylobacter polymorphus]
MAMNVHEIPAEADEVLALRLRALAHPARLAIVRALAQTGRCQCGQIVRGLTLAQSTVSQHLKVLKEAGLITGTIEGPRSCYCLDRATVQALADEVLPLLARLAAPAAEAEASETDAPGNPDPRAGALA